MKRTCFKDMDCPAAQALECVGEWWSILIIRDAFRGLSRFDDFQNSLGIATGILTKRLKHLTENGLLTRSLYNDKPPRYEYILTQKGRDFFPVLLTLYKWGNQHLTTNVASLELANLSTGQAIDPIVVDKQSLVEITHRNLILKPGPGASAELKARLLALRGMRRTQ